MPKVTKQTNVPKPVAKAEGVLGRIGPVTVAGGGLKVLVFGQSKTGKTRFSSTFPKPLLIIGTQDGAASPM